MMPYLSKLCLAGSRNANTQLAVNLAGVAAQNLTAKGPGELDG
jgi:hypothetical protein